jgi:hypothetical protein
LPPATWVKFYHVAGGEGIRRRLKSQIFVAKNKAFQY